MLTHPIKEMRSSALVIRCPAIIWSKAAEAEKANYGIVRRRLYDLASFCLAFEASLYLFENAGSAYAERKRAKDFASGEVYKEWARIAARDAGVVVYHYRRALDSLNEAFAQCPSLQSTATPAKLKDAWKPFRQRFKDATALRNAVTHLVDMTFDEAQREKNSINKPFSIGTSITSAGKGVEYTSIRGATCTWTTFKGILVSYDLNEESLDCLISTTLAVYGCFPSRVQMAESYLKSLYDKP